MALAAALAALAGFAAAEVIVETTKNLRPFRMYEDQPARFGSGLPEEGLVGFLVVAEPVDACAALAPAPLDRPNQEVKQPGWGGVHIPAEGGARDGG